MKFTTTGDHTTNTWQYGGSNYRDNNRNVCPGCHRCNVCGRKEYYVNPHNPYTSPQGPYWYEPVRITWGSGSVTTPSSGDFIIS